MDIVAESLSANILRARNVTVRGQDVLAWFESKLSASVSFVGVFDDLSAAPARNGAVAIVGNKDYIYSSTTSAWQEFGDEGQIGALTQAIAALSSDISGCATSSDVDIALSAKRDLLDLFYMVKPQPPDAFDKWVLTSPLERYSKVVLVPYDDPNLDQEAGEMAWSWRADEVTDGRAAYLTWNGESIWTLLVQDGLLIYLSASTGGEWDDMSVSFTGENGEWVIDRAAKADTLALDGNIKKWVEKQNYLTSHQDITGKQDKISVDGILSCDGNGIIAPADAYTKGEVDAKIGALPTAEALSAELNGIRVVAQNAAASAEAANINVGLCATKAELNNHAGNTAVHITAAERAEWNAKQSALPLEIGQSGKESSLKLKVANSAYANKATAPFAVSLGYQSESTAARAFTTGTGTKATALNAHAEGALTEASASAAHAEGRGTKAANANEHAEGQYNISHSGAIQSIGIGSADNDRKNAVLVMLDGRVYVNGVGGYTGTETTLTGKKSLQTVINETPDPDNTKLDSTSAAPAFDATATYDVGNYVTHDGQLYRCTTAVTTAGAWDATNWTVENMTSPDATLDVTSAGRLRLVDTDGTVLWQQGYDLAAESSVTLSCDTINFFAFAATTVPAFDNTATYAVDDRVTYGGVIYKCTTVVETAGAWTGVANWTEDPDTQAFALPTAPSGKAGDFVLDIDNSANTVAATASLTGLDAEFSIVVPSNQSLAQMLAFAAGEMAELYFTQTAFKVNDLPTWKLARQTVENGGAQA